MKKITVILISILTILACKKSIKVIPEITSLLTNKKIIDLESDKKFLTTITNTGPEILYISRSGEIFSLNTTTGEKKLVIDLKKELSEEGFAENDQLVLRRSDSAEYFVIDTLQKKIFKRFQNSKIRKIIGINRDYLIFRTKSKIVILDLNSGKGITEFKYSGQVFNTLIGKQQIHIMTGKTFYTFNRTSKQINRIKFAQPASSGFLLHENSIYYGTQQRELVRMDLNAQKVKWRITIGKVLKVAPKMAEDYITISPEDNNIYFFYPNGSLYWWQKYGSTQSVPLIVMKNNIATLLRNDKIKFFNPKKKQVINQEYKYTRKSNFVVYDGNLYSIARTEKDQILLKTGNMVGAYLEINPKNLKPVGRSIEFTLKAANLIHPEFLIKIINQSKKQVFTTKFSENDQLSFFWIPNKPGKYKIISEIKADNLTGHSEKTEFKVVDLLRFAQKVFYDIQTECRSGYISNKK